jgi:hypothetical protein
MKFEGEGGKKHPDFFDPAKSIVLGDDPNPFLSPGFEPTGIILDRSHGEQIQPPVGALGNHAHSAGTEGFGFLLTVMERPPKLPLTEEPTDAYLFPRLPTLWPPQHLSGLDSDARLCL